MPNREITSRPIDSLRFRFDGRPLAIGVLAILLFCPLTDSRGQEQDAKSDKTGSRREKRERKKADRVLKGASDIVIDKPILFNTPEADAILEKLQVFPAEHPLNQRIVDWPVLPNSSKTIEFIGADKPLRYNPDMCFVLVPPDQPRVKVKVTSYASESDSGPFPVPDNLPVEGWPLYATQAKATLEEWQLGKQGGDRHGIVVDPIAGLLIEFGQIQRTEKGQWQAAQSSVFLLKRTKFRREGWTSADAAGLPIFPLVIRHDELKNGKINHPIRVTVPKTRKEYVFPARHHAGHTDDPNAPRMGERFRLKADYPIERFSPEAQTVLRALKEYGLIVADNGLEWAMSCAPDQRIPMIHEELRMVRGKEFEVVAAPRPKRGALKKEREQQP